MCRVKCTVTCSAELHSYSAEDMNAGYIQLIVAITELPRAALGHGQLVVKSRILQE